MAVIQAILSVIVMAVLSVCCKGFSIVESDGGGTEVEISTLAVGGGDRLTSVGGAEGEGRAEGAGGVENPRGALMLIAGEVEGA